jgi:sortase A
MFKRQDKLEKISVAELEQILRLKQRKARQERFLRLSATGASNNAALLADDELMRLPTTNSTPPPNAPSSLGQQLTAAPIPKSRQRRLRDMALLAVEVIAVVGLIVILISSYLNLRTLNHEVAEVQSTSRLQQVVSERLFDQSETTASQSTFAVDRLPGGHSSPTAPGGALPDIPAHLQNWVLPQPAAVAVPSQESASATRIVIPKINVDAPIIQGVTWEDLKKGVGQLPGSAKPGERGNMYLAAHNDIYGEIFRYLEDLEPGDEYYIYTGETKFTYVVREKRIIEPTETSVMLPTTEPVATLQTCYPYLIDTHRLVVISDLIE